LLDSSRCGYDNLGNLFVDGYDGQLAGLSELTSGSNKFVKLNISKYTPLPPSQVQWDGHYITYESVNKGQIMVSRLRISGSDVTVVGVTHFNIKGRAYQSWIHRDSIFIPYARRGADATRVGAWSYPKGGAPLKSFKVVKLRFGNLNGVTLSLAPR
jgi:hypothetical protein